jgi:hypothetical protein
MEVEEDYKIIKVHEVVPAHSLIIPSSATTSNSLNQWQGNYWPECWSQCEPPTEDAVKVTKARKPGKKPAKKFAVVSTDPKTEDDKKLEKDYRKAKEKNNRLSYFAFRNQKLREEGKAYQGRTKKSDSEVVEKEAKKLLPCCTSTSRCRMDSRRNPFDCCLVTDEYRDTFFKEFWALSWESKQVMVKSLAERLEPKKRKDCTDSKRTTTWRYFLRDSNGRPMRVCKLMLASTIGIPQNTLSKWLETKTKLKSKTRATPSHHKDYQRKKVALLDYLSQLPRLESKKDGKIILVRQWQSTRQFYE